MDDYKKRVADSLLERKLKSAGAGRTIPGNFEAS